MLKRLLVILLFSVSCWSQTTTWLGQATYKNQMQYLGSRIALNQTSLSYGNQTQGTTSASQSVTVTNTGTDWLVVTLVGLTPNYTQTNNCSSLIAPLGTCTINVSFAPTTIGSLPGTLSVFSNSPVNNPLTVSLSGTGTSVSLPTVSLTPSSLTFQPGTINDLTNWMMMANRTTQFMSGTNSESSWVDVDGQKIWHVKGSGTRGYPWDIRKIDTNWIYWWVTDNSFTLDPSAYKRFVTPVPLVPRYFTLGTTFDTGELPGPNTVQANVGGGIGHCATETTVNLGHIHGVTSGPTNLPWTITNVGTVTLPTIEVDYFWGGTNGSGIYNTRERYYFVQFYGLVKWDSSDCSSGTCQPPSQTSNFNVLNSTGGSPNPQFTCSNQSWWIGAQPSTTNVTTEQTVTLQNTGGTTLNISSLVTSGDYSSWTNCGATVASGATCNITTAFSPIAQSPPPRTGAVTITSNSTTSPDAVSLTGNGVTFIPPPPSNSENKFCSIGDVCNFGGFDGPAQLPQAGIYTGLDGTPSGTRTNGTAGVTYRICGDGITSGFGCAFYNADIQSALNIVQCGDTIELIAGQNYTSPAGSWMFLSDTCDNNHWHWFRSTNISSTGAGLNGFPAEHVQATPCFINRTSVPGYPTYACASPADLMPHVHSNVSGNPQFVVQQRGASHWRFMGIDFSNPGLGTAKISAQAFFTLGAANAALSRVDTGADHFIYDRCLFHGPDYAYQSAQIGDSTQKVIHTADSNYVALINSWVYEIYLFLRNGATVTQTDAQTIAGSGGFFAEGPIKVFNNVLAASGETILYGGGGNYTYGQAYGPTQNAHNLEIRNNMMIKPWTWMVPWGVYRVQPTLLYPCVKNSLEIKNAQFILVEGNTFENGWVGQSDENGPGPVFDPRNQNLTVQPAPTVNVNGATVTSSNFVFTTDNAQDWYWDTPIPCNGCGITPAGHWGAPRKPRRIKLALTGGTQTFIVQSVSNPSLSNPVGCDNVAGNVDATGYPIQPNLPNPACKFGTVTLTTSTGVTQSGVTATVCHPGQSPDAQTSDVAYRYNDLHTVILGVNPIVNPSSNCADDTYTFFGNYSLHDNVNIGLNGNLSNATSSTFGWNTSNSAFSISFGNFEASPVTWMQNILVAHNSGSFVNGSIGGGKSGGSMVDSLQQNAAPDGNGAFFPNVKWLDNILPGPQQWNWKAGSASQPAVQGLNQQSCSDHGLSAGINNPVPGPLCSWQYADNVMGIGLPSGQSIIPGPFPNTNCETSGVQCVSPNVGTGCGSGATCFPNSTTYQALFNRYNGGYWFNGQTGLYADLTLNPATASAYIGTSTDGKNLGADMVTKAAVQGSSYLTTTFTPINITTLTLPNATHGVAYSQNIIGTGGASLGRFLLWTVSGGSLSGCNGITLRLDGLLSGTPTAAGSCSFTVQAQDVVNQTDTQALTLTVN